MSDATIGTDLAQKLDAALADYQRHFGRQRAIAKLQHMLDRAAEAQRILDDAANRIGAVRRAAE